MVFGESARYLAQLPVAIAARPHNEPAMAAVREAMLSLARDYENASVRIRALSSIVERTPSLLAHSVTRRAAWEDAIAEALAGREGRSTPGLEDRLVAACSIAALRVAFSQWMKLGGSGSLRNLVAGALDRLNHGLGTSGSIGPGPRT